MSVRSRLVVLRLADHCIDKCLQPGLQACAIIGIGQAETGSRQRLTKPQGICMNANDGDALAFAPGVFAASSAVKLALPIMFPTAV
jgi:hypothetical protein